MKKLFAIFTVTLLLSGISFSQTNPMYFGGALNLGLPVGTFGDIAGMGIGVTGQFEMKFTPNLIGTGTIGYMKWGGKDFGTGTYSISTVPILVGAKYYFTPTAPVYGMANLGITILSQSIDFKNSIYNQYLGSISGSTSSSEFTFAIGGGYEVPLTPTIILDLNAAFNIISNANYIGIKAGVKFPL